MARVGLECGADVEAGAAETMSTTDVGTADSVEACNIGVAELVLWFASIFSASVVVGLECGQAEAVTLCRVPVLYNKKIA